MDTSSQIDLQLKYFIFIVEDDDELYDSIKYKLVILINKVFLEKFEHIKIFRFESKIKYDKFEFEDCNAPMLFITDILLGRNRNAGIDIIRENKMRFINAVHIVHTALPDKEDDCNELDVPFIGKGYTNNKNSEDQVIDLVEQYLRSYFMPSAEYDIPQGIKKPDIDYLRTICVDKNFIVDFENLPLPAKLSLAALILNPLNFGTTFYSVAGKLFILDYKTGRSDYEKSESNILLSVSESNEVEGIRFHSIKELMWIDFNTVKTNSDKIVSIIYNHDSEFIRILLEYWLSMRLANFYCEINNSNNKLCVTSVDVCKKELVEIVTSLTPETGQFVFMITVWELFAKIKNKNKDITISMIQNDLSQILIHVEDLFYCEIETTEEKQEVSYVKLMSIEDSVNSSYKYFNNETLNKYGICAEADRFKLVLYHERIQGNAFYILPVPPNIKF